MSVADSYVATLANLKSFLTTNSVDWFTMLPNATTGLMTGYPAPTRRFWNYIKAGCLNQGIPVVDAERVMYKIWQFLYPDGSVTYPAWLQTCMYDGSTHPNSKGFSIFESLFQPIFDQI